MLLFNQDNHKFLICKSFANHIFCIYQIFMYNYFHNSRPAKKTSFPDRVSANIGLWDCLLAALNCHIKVFP